MSKVQKFVMVMTLCTSAIAAHRGTKSVEVCEDVFTQMGDKQPNISRPSLSNGSAFSYLSKANSYDRIQVVRLTFDSKSPSKAYALQVDERNTEYFALSEVGRMAERMREFAIPNGFMYWLPHGFDSETHENALDSTVRVQWAKHDPSLKLRLRPLRMEGNLSREIDGALFPSAFFEPGAKVGKVSAAEEVLSGPHKGWFRVLLDVTVGAGAAIVRMTFTIFIKSASIAGVVGSQLQSYALRTTSDKTLTSAIILSQMERNLREKYPDLGVKDVFVLMKNEFGSSYLVREDQAGFHLE